MEKTIIHVDMDAFYASVEVRDNPALRGKPLIIGALPHERGVVATCSYEARAFGVHSAMSIKDAYRCCPNGVYMHPNMDKYKQASDILHKIWLTYTDIVEYVSLDEGYLDVSGSMHMFGGVTAIANAIKQCSLAEVGLTCSVGIGYSMATAKLASEERKPNGLYEIPTPEHYFTLVNERPARILYGVGIKTAEKLKHNGINTVRDVRANRALVTAILGKHGTQIADLAEGIDSRRVTPYYQDSAKSISRECTFQHDITEHDYLNDVLVLLAKELSMTLRLSSLYARTVTLKITYSNMKSITRSKSGESTNNATEIYRTAAALLASIDKQPIRLIGIGLDNLSIENTRQLSLDDIAGKKTNAQLDALDKSTLELQRKYGADIVQSGTELKANKRLKDDLLS